MIVVRVRFRRSGKGYDYLYDNPCRYELPTKILTGVSKNGVTTSPIFITSFYKTSVLPGYVTAKLIPNSDRTCRTVMITLDERRYLNA